MTIRKKLTINTEVELIKEEEVSPVEEEQPSRQTEWPQMLEDPDEPAGAGFNISFFLGSTKEDPANPGQWIDLDIMTQDPQELGTLSFSIDEGLAYVAPDLYGFRYYPENHEYVYIGNDFNPSQAEIEAEFGSANNDRFNRRPIEIVGSEDAKDRRAPLGDGIYNVRIELIRGEDNAVFDVCQDLIEDETTTGKVKQTGGDGTDPLNYKWTNPKIGTFGLKVTEKGTRSYRHYFKRAKESATLEERSDWIEPEGIFLPVIDTSDSVNFKVTTEPDYTADEVTGKFIKLFPGVKLNVEFYWMTRTWAYYVRHSTWTELYEDLSDPIYHTVECVYRSYYGANQNPCVSDAAIYRREDVQSTGCLEQTMLGDCISASGAGAAHCGIVGGTYVCEWKEFGGSGCGFTIESTVVSPSFCNTDNCAVTYAPVHNFIFRLKPLARDIKHYVGLWYTSAPHDFEVPFVYAEDFTALNTALEGCNDTTEIEPELVLGDRSKANAIQDAIDAGCSAEIQDDILTGFNAFHIGIGEPLYFSYLSTAYEPYVTQGSLYGTVLSAKQGLAFEQYIDSLTVDSDFWSAYRDLSDYANKLDPSDQHIGIGICPEIAGSLLAMVKVNHQVFYIWRRTDEAFTLYGLSNVEPEYAGCKFGFEDEKTNYDLADFHGFVEQLDGVLGKCTHIGRTVVVECDEDCASHGPCFSDVGSQCNLVPQSGQIELEAPVYPMLLRYKPS